MVETPETSETSIVIVGAFNPAIFQPSWLAAQKLISDNDASQVKEILISPELAFVNLSWVRFQVAPERFIAATTQDSESGMLRDLVAGAFRLLRYTPIRQLGINVEQHFKMENQETWNSFGHKLAPKDKWHGIMQDPGLRSMAMQEKAPRPDPFPGSVRVDVGGSRRVKPHGIFFRVNDHFECQEMKPQAAGTESLLRILDTQFSESLRRSNEMIQKLFGSLK